MHKQNATFQNSVVVTDKRLELQTLLNEQTLWVRDKNRTLYYQHGNKAGKLLARALLQRISTTSVVKVKTEAGDVVHDPKGILKTFHTFLF